MKPETPNSRTSQAKDLHEIYQNKIKLQFYTFRTQTFAGRFFTEEIFMEFMFAVLTPIREFKFRENY